MKTTALTLTAALALTSAAFAGSEPSGKMISSPPPPAPACELSYDYVEALYTHSVYDDGFGDEGNGGEIVLSYSPVNHLYLTGAGAWERADEIISGGEFDSWTLSAGVGGYLPLCASAHLCAEVGVIYGDCSGDIPAAHVSDTAFYARPYLRTCFGPVELRAGAEYNDLYDGQWVAQTAAYIKLTSNLDLTLKGEWSDAADFYKAGLRFRF